MSKKNISRRGKSSNTQKIWRTHVGAWQKSGLSRAEYCRQNNLSPHALGYWHKKYKKSDPVGMTLVPVPIGGNYKHEVKELQTRSAELKIEIGNRFKIGVPDGFTAATLARLITTLEAC
jgi:hypothetical protein